MHPFNILLIVTALSGVGLLYVTFGLVGTLLGVFVTGVLLIIATVAYGYYTQGTNKKK